MGTYTTELRVLVDGRGNSMVNDAAGYIVVKKHSTIHSDDKAILFTNYSIFCIEPKLLERISPLPPKTR